MNDTVTRFCGLSEIYHRYRPGYPDELISVLSKETGLAPDHIIADIGSGTGLSSIPFLKNGNIVYGIEPNPEMRKIALEALKDHPKFMQLPGTAENPGLPSSSVDYILAGQSLHWFDLEKCRHSFRHIAKQGTWLVIIFQERASETPFMKALEKLIKKYSIDYNQVDHRRVDEKALKAMFKPYKFKEKVFPYEQQFDEEGLKGRLLSCSYLPVNANIPGYNHMVKELSQLFDQFNENGNVTMSYHCRFYYGRVS